MSTTQRKVPTTVYAGIVDYGPFTMIVEVAACDRTDARLRINRIASAALGAPVRCRCATPFAPIH